MNIFIIIASILFLVLIIGFLIISNNTRLSNISSLKQFNVSCLTDVDCDNGQKCIFDPDYQKNTCVLQSQKYCEITKDTLISCSPTGDGSECLVCINGTEAGPTGLNFSCVTLDNNNAGLYSSLFTGVTGGSYCLPKMATGEHCNIYTSDTILSKNLDGSYQWKCLCKNNNRLFQTNISSGDCTSLYACNNGKYPLYVPNSNTFCKSNADCSTNEYCLDIHGNTFGQDPKSITGYCWLEWNDKLNIDPFRSGICLCEDGKYSFRTTDAAGNVILECLNDTCSYGLDSSLNKTTVLDFNTTKGESIMCSCQSGYISCPEDITKLEVCTDPTSPSYNSKCISKNVDAKRMLCKDAPECIEDPCTNKFCSNNKSCTNDNDCSGSLNNKYNRCINNFCVSTANICETDDYCNQPIPCDNFGNIKCESGTCTNGICDPPENRKTCKKDLSYYDKNEKKCVCNPGMTNVFDNYSLVGQKCIDPCSENPCGNRGICYIDKDGKQKCKDCNQPYSNSGDNTNKCMTILTGDYFPCDKNEECWSNICKETIKDFKTQEYVVKLCIPK
jgi:hypothetical protein